MRQLCTLQASTNQLQLVLKLQESKLCRAPFQSGRLQSHDIVRWAWLKMVFNGSSNMRTIKAWKTTTQNLSGCLVIRCQISSSQEDWAQPRFHNSKGPQTYLSGPCHVVGRSCKPVTQSLPTPKISSLPTPHHFQHHTITSNTNNTSLPTPDICCEGGAGWGGDNTKRVSCYATWSSVALDGQGGVGWG